MTEVSIAGMSKGEVLAALYNAAIDPIGDKSPIPLSEARYFTQTRLYYDSLGYRMLGVDLSTDWFDSTVYDNLNGGPGAAEKVINRLRETGLVTPEQA